MSHTTIHPHAGPSNYCVLCMWVMHEASRSTMCSRQWKRGPSRTPTSVACQRPSARCPFRCGCHTISWNMVLRSMGREASVKP